MQYSVAIHKPYGEVLAGLWDAQRFEFDQLEGQPFPGDVSDADLFVAGPSKVFEPEQIVGSVHEGRAYVLGKLILPQLLITGSSDTLVVFPESVEPVTHKVVEAIEGSRLTPARTGKGYLGASHELLSHQARLFAKDISTTNPFSLWTAAMESEGSREHKAVYLEAYNRHLVTYQRYLNFLLSVEGAVPNNERHVLESIQNLGPR